MNLLAFDTSNETVAVALSVQGRRFAESAPGGAAASANLLPLVQALLQRAGVDWSQLQAVAFGMGPGAFTGLRTSCAVAQGLGFGLGLPLLPLDSLLIVAEDALDAGSAGGGQLTGDGEHAVVVDARMAEAYAARYRRHAGRWHTVDTPALVAPADLAVRWANAGTLRASGNGWSVFRDALAGLPLEGAPAVERDRAAALLRLALQAHADGAHVPPEQALPLYLRDKVAWTTAERQAAAQASAVAAAIPPRAQAAP